MMPSPAELWMLAGLLLMGLELAAPGAFMMWVGVACLGTGLLTLAGPGFALQVIVFTVLCAISVAAGWYLRRHPSHAALNTPASGLVGRSARSLGFSHGEGRVRVGDSDWSARLADGAPEPGPTERLDVVGVAGTVLVVRPHALPGTGKETNPAR